MNNKLWLIISREYSLRVRKKSFIITTLLFPIILAVLILFPVIFHDMGSDTLEEIAVVDASGEYGYELTKSSSFNYVMSQTGEDNTVKDGCARIILQVDSVGNLISASILSNHNLGVQMLAEINGDINDAAANVNLLRSGVPGIVELVNAAKVEIPLLPLLVNEDGNTEESGVLSGFLIGMAVSFTLYMFILIYGQIVMHSIIDEKSNRVVEVIVSSISSTKLLLGKILGIGAVALTQIGIWVIIIMVFVKFLLPQLLSPEETVSLLPILGSVDELFAVFGYLAVFLAGGYLLYSSIYAALGASVDNAQDGAQLQTFATLPIIVALMLSINVGNSPDSSLATILSIVPFTSPMVMMMRIPVGVSAVEIALSVAVLFASALMLLWISARIYRVGIFKYGKKPTIKEILSWTKFK